MRNMPTSRLLDLLEEENCVVSAAHPMGYLGSNKGLEVCIRKDYIPVSEAKRLDAFEVMSGGISRRSNIAACESASGYGLGVTGGQGENQRLSPTEGYWLFVTDDGRLAAISA